MLQPRRRDSFPGGSFTPAGVWFSLGPGSPSLGADSPADIFFSSFDGSYSVKYAAESLALLETDNVDALELQPLSSPEEVPEPGLIALFVGGATTSAISRRRRRGVRRAPATGLTPTR